MATLLRFAARQSCRILSNNAIKQKKTLQPYYCISTSKKNKESATLGQEIQTTETQDTKEDENDTNWISFGVDYRDKEEDAFGYHAIMFFGVTVALIGGSFMVAYMPDLRRRDWTQREAYLELARREENGLPLIDGNLIDPAKIELPPDEELGDFEINV